MGAAKGLYREKQWKLEAARLEQFVDATMSRQVHQHLQTLIHLRLGKDLVGPDIDRDSAQFNEDKENEREDPGREHNR